jgi:hypothetical protein
MMNKELSIMSKLDASMSRRRALKLGGSVAGGLVAASSSLIAAPNLVAASTRMSATVSSGLPVQEIEDIIGSTGTVSDGVLSITLARLDLHVIGPQGIPFQPFFELTHEFHFQALGHGQALFNGDITILPQEAQPVIDEIFQEGLVFQAFHQHFVDEHPQTFHIHFRGIDDAIQLARKVVNVVKQTGTPLPQPKPPHPTTPLPAQELANILGGTADILPEGIVEVTVERANTIILAGIALKPDMGQDVTVAFEPLGGNEEAACAPDYSLTSSEVNPALEESRNQGFEVHCLYNQETDEHPQLYFSHNIAKGNAIDLAQRVSRVLDRIQVRRVS